jgi:DNA-binding PadR family transcriptional regulator
LQAILILAALERAELHTPRAEPGVMYSVIVDHLGLRMGSATGRVLVPRLAALEEADLVTGRKQHSVIKWQLTRKGREELGAARGAGSVGELPESPQHRHWREAHAAATQRIGGFRASLRRSLIEAIALLARSEADAAAWSQAGERLAQECSRLSSATYCLQEWAEPSDDAADTDDRNKWRRSTSKWDSD